MYSSWQILYIFFLLQFKKSVFIVIISSPGKRLWKLASQLYPLNCAPTDEALQNNKRIKSVFSISAPETEQ